MASGAAQLQRHRERPVSSAVRLCTDARHRCATSNAHPVDPETRRRTFSVVSSRAGFAHAGPDEAELAGSRPAPRFVPPHLAFSRSEADLGCPRNQRIGPALRL